MLSLTHSGSLWHNMVLTLALSGAPRLTRSLLRGSPSRGRVATVYPNLLYSKHCKIIFRWEMSKLPQLFFLQPDILLPSFFADLQPSTSHMILWLDTKLSARSAKLKKKRGRIKVCLLFLASLSLKVAREWAEWRQHQAAVIQGAISSSFCISFEVLFLLHFLSLFQGAILYSCLTLHHQPMMRNSWRKEVILENCIFQTAGCLVLKYRLLWYFMPFTKRRLLAFTRTCKSN